MDGSSFALAESDGRRGRITMREQQGLEGCGPGVCVCVCVAEAGRGNEGSMAVMVGDEWKGDDVLAEMRAGTPALLVYISSTAFRALQRKAIRSSSESKMGRCKPGQHQAARIHRDRTTAAPADWTWPVRTALAAGCSFLLVWSELPATSHGARC